MMSDVIPLNSWKGKLSSSKQGYKKNMTNLMLCMENVTELGLNLRFNELSQKIEWYGEPLEEHQLVDIRVILEGHDFEPKVSDLLPAVMRHARNRSIHPVRDYLRSLKWDGTHRLDRWLHTCLGAADTPFTRAVGRKTLVAAVARALRPGCKVDTVLILEGPQGIKKSTAIATLFGRELTLESVNLFDDHKRMVMDMMGKWVVELAEFVAALKRDEAAVKGMISTQVDSTTLPYAKTSTDHPRSVVFIGTYNPDGLGYFNDVTGNRRYWPVPVTKADITLLAARRDQLWAEALHAFEAGEQWWLTDEEDALAKVEVERRQSTDVWEEYLYEKMVKVGVQSTSVAAALTLIGVPPERMDKRARNRVAKVLRNLKYLDDPNPGKDEEGRSIRIFRRAG